MVAMRTCTCSGVGADAACISAHWSSSSCRCGGQLLSRRDFGLDLARCLAQRLHCVAAPRGEQRPKNEHSNAAEHEAARRAPAEQE